MEALWHEIRKGWSKRRKTEKERTKRSYETNKIYVKRKGGEMTQAELQVFGV